MKARLAHWYGWTDKEISNLRWSTFKDYLKCTEILEAQSTMAMIQSTSYPNLKSQKDRDKIYSFYSKKASNIESEKKKQISIDDFANILAKGSNGF